MKMEKLALEKEEYLLIKDFKDIEKYRYSLNHLVKKTYGFDFEVWYQKGYWTDKYRPYSILCKDEIIANVSVNPIDFLADGKMKKTLQIGTVMTDEAFRCRGLSRLLIETVLKEYEASCDLIYLYANDTVLEFYPKFGFKKEEEYIYTGIFNQGRDKLSIRKLNMNDGKDIALITRLVKNTIPVSRYQMTGNPELVFFYLTSMMSDNIYYFKEIDLAAVVETGVEDIHLLDIYSEKSFDLNEVIRSLVYQDGMKVSLGFTPLNQSLFYCERLKEEGLTFFTKKDCFIDKGRFPALSHA